MRRSTEVLYPIKTQENSGWQHTKLKVWGEHRMLLLNIHDYDNTGDFRDLRFCCWLTATRSANKPTVTEVQRRWASHLQRTEGRYSFKALCYVKGKNTCTSKAAAQLRTARPDTSHFFIKGKLWWKQSLCVYTRDQTLTFWLTWKCKSGKKSSLNWTERGTSYVFEAFSLLWPYVTQIWTWRTIIC